MINRIFPTPSNACHIPIEAPIPINPHANERLLGRAREIANESISANGIDACKTLASGAPRSNTLRFVKTTSEPPLP